MSKFSVTIYGETVAEIVARAAELANGQLPQGGGMTSTHGFNPSSAPMLPAGAGEDGPVNANPPDLDAAGIPWDERIHAGTKATKNDGTWQRRRNTDDAVYNAVMAELQARRSQPAAAPPMAPPAVQAGVDATMAASPPPPFVPPANVVIPPQASTMPPVPPVQAASVPPAPQPPAVTGMPFGAFMPKFSAGLQAGRFNEQQWREYFGQWGITELGQLATDPVKTEALYNAIKAAGWVE